MRKIVITLLLSALLMPATLLADSYTSLWKQYAAAQKKDLPQTQLKVLQDTGDFTSLLVMQEELKTLPFGEIWSEYCRRCGVPCDGEWLADVKQYEKDVLLKRV